MADGRNSPTVPQVADKSCTNPGSAVGLYHLSGSARELDTQVRRYTTLV